MYDNSWDLPGAPIDFTAVVTMNADGRKARFSIHLIFRDAESYRTAVERYGILDGGIQTVDRIAEYLERLG